MWAGRRIGVMVLAPCPDTGQRVPEVERSLRLIGVESADEVLRARLAAGDDEALAEIYDRYAGFVFGVACHVTGPLGAEDVVQEVFINVWRNPAGFDPQRGSLRTYLGVQAHRRAIDQLRGDARRKDREKRSSVLDPWFGSRPDEIEGAVLAEEIRNAIGRLPDPQREAVELAFWEGKTYKEVAACLGVPEGTAKSRLRLAQARLSELLAPVHSEVR